MDGEWAREPKIIRRANGTKEKLKQLLLDSVEKRAGGLGEAALLFSGGVDSSLLALLLKDRLELHCYCAATKESHDWQHSKAVADEMGLELTRIELTKGIVEKALPKIAGAIGSHNIMKLGVAMPLWVCCGEMAESHVFFGMGTEELFAGYQRHRRLLPNYRAIDEECWKGAMGAWERDLSRDIGVCKAWGREALFPYLDREFVEEALAIPSEQKISAENNKLVLREIAVELGLPEEIAYHPKKSAQYGSHADKLIRKLAKEKRMRPEEYVRSL